MYPDRHPTNSDMHSALMQTPAAASGSGCRCCEPCRHGLCGSWLAWGIGSSSRQLQHSVGGCITAARHCTCTCTRWGSACPAASKTMPRLCKFCRQGNIDIRVTSICKTAPAKQSAYRHRTTELGNKATSTQSIAHCGVNNSIGHQQCGCCLAPGNVDSTPPM
jgi:hypothetical protein